MSTLFPLYAIQIGYVLFLFHHGPLLCGHFLYELVSKIEIGLSTPHDQEDEEAAESLGIDARWCKIKAYSIASAFVAVGGGFLAVYNLYIDPYSVMDLDLPSRLP